MLSEAGKSYDKTRVVSPYNTRQRWRYYQLDPVKSNQKIPKQYQTLEINLRQKRDSFILRHTKETTVNTNHFPDFQTVRKTSPRQIFPKAVFERYIGDIKNEDYSTPLQQNCDHRCAQANSRIPISQKVSASTDRTSSRMDSSMLEMASVNKQQNNTADLSANLHGLDLSKKFYMNDLKSTENSLIKKRSKLTIQVQKNTPKAGKIRGASFDSSIGHQYLPQPDDKERRPEFYEIQKSNESLIKKSFNQPRINVKFGTFRNSIATRYDRADPNWHLQMDISNCEIQQKDLSYNFDHYSARKINEVKNKYPHRASMNIYMFPVKELKV